MYPIILAVLVAIQSISTVGERASKISFTWAVELTVTDGDGRDHQFHFFNEDKGLMRIHGPTDWVCGFKVDEMRVTDIGERTIFFQNAFIGCMAPDGVMMNAGANVSVINKSTIERETNLTYGKHNEYSARLIPCVGQYIKLCAEWKNK